MTAKTATTAEIATALQTTPRELRKFLRSTGSGVGKGSRYALPANKAELTRMGKNFAKWAEAAAEAKAAKKAETDNAPEADITDETTDDSDSLEPTDADLDAIDDNELEGLNDSIDD